MFTRPLAALLLTSFVALGAQAPSAALVTRSYDLALLAPDTRDDGLSFPMLPFDEGTADGGDELDLQDLVTTLVQDVVAPEEFQYEGRRLESYGDRKLLVTAPPAVHSEVARLLDGLATSFRRTATLELSVERLTDGVSMSEELAQLSPEALRAAGLTQGGQRQLIELSVGQGHRVRSEQRDQVVRTWQSEIAQSSLSVLPVTALLRTGLDVVLRLEAGFDGTYRLRSVGRVGAITRQESRRVAVSGRTLFDGGVQPLLGATPVDDVVTAWTAFCGAARLRPGESTHQLLWTRTQEGSAGWILGMRLVEVEQAPVLRFGERLVTVTDLSTLMCSPQVGVELTEVANLERPEELLWLEAESGRRDTTWADYGTGLRLELPTGEGSLDDSAYEQVNMLDERDAEVWHEGNWLVAWGPADALSSWEAEALAPLGDVTPLILEVGVDGTGRTKSGFDGPQARLHLNLQSGDEVTALVGDARNYVSGFSADVANSAMVRLPEVSDLLDGLFLSARSSADFVQLELNYGRLLDWNTLELDYTAHTGLDRPRLLKGSLSARLRPDGQARVLGELGSGTKDGPRMQVWARLRRGDTPN